MQVNMKTNIWDRKILAVKNKWLLNSCDDCQHKFAILAKYQYQYFIDEIIVTNWR